MLHRPAIGFWGLVFSPFFLAGRSGLETGGYSFPLFNGVGELLSKGYQQKGVRQWRRTGFADTSLKSTFF